jgi:hypothetical protein
LPSLGATFSKSNVEEPRSYERRVHSQYSVLCFYNADVLIVYILASLPQIDPLVNSMRAIAEARDVSVSAVALNWVLAKGCIPLGGARNANQAQQNAKALDWSVSVSRVLALTALPLFGSMVDLWVIDRYCFSLLLPDVHASSCLTSSRAALKQEG